MSYTSLCLVSYTSLCRNLLFIKNETKPISRLTEFLCNKWKSLASCQKREAGKCSIHGVAAMAGNIFTPPPPSSPLLGGHLQIYHNSPWSSQFSIGQLHSPPSSFPHSNTASALRTPPSVPPASESPTLVTFLPVPAAPDTAASPARLLIGDM